jgi:hypothetical protein
VNQTSKKTGSTIGKLLTERVAVWSVPLGVIVIVGAFYAGNLMAGNRRSVTPPTVVKPPAAYGIAEPVYTSIPNMTPAREAETDLVISANPQPKAPAVEKPVVRDNRVVQQSESIDFNIQQDGITTGAAEDSTYDANGYKMDSVRPAEPSSLTHKSSNSSRVNGTATGVPGRYPHVAEKPRPDASPKTGEIVKDDPWNGETRRRYDSFFNEADFRDGHRLGGK